MPLVNCPDCGRQVSTAAQNCPQCGRPIGPGFAPTAVAAPPGAENVLWEGVPSLKAMVVEIVATSLYAIVLPIAAVLVWDPLMRLGGSVDFVANNRPAFKLALIAFVVTVVAARAVKLAWHVLVLRSHRYRVSNQRIVLESGVFSKQIDEIDMRTVEDIEFKQRFLQRLLGIGEILIVGSDRTEGRVRLLGVEKPREVREMIRTSAYQATRGQLFTRST
jgi:uncharacterized membrane protein YdbT with pleckstrin-like domain